ncbi:hypothetical protein T069G_01714 [Trichoderma breve]|uniref:Uncharacterized protein n=1 Tax=Trichoderma breve TaxID=2034170 RepID=A0A9W9JRP6_9HYPO|nr:hypothetical protein T069G_01714 [Trichoderma breve]KAJ4865184.1 hypothetical protein T069G_01714 [Trichoderma breve]
MAPKRSISNAGSGSRKSQRLVKLQPAQGANSILHYFSKSPTDKPAEISDTAISNPDNAREQDSQDLEVEEKEDLALTSEVEADDFSESDEDETCTSEADNAEEHQTPEAKYTARTEQIQIMLRHMGLPSDLFDPEAHTNWLSILLHTSSASDEVKQEIHEFSKKIKETTFPESTVDVVEWQQDDNRRSWHSHCPKMDDIWEEYLAGLVNILGENSDFKLSTMAKPSGPLGAVLHMQWHYPVDAKRRVSQGHHFRHVLDTNNRSLFQQEKKMGTPLNVSVSDMIPIRQPSRNPN